MPGNPTVSLTLDGWLNSSARPRIIVIIDYILEAYRNKASNTEQDLDQGLDGTDLQSVGLTDHDAGLLSACGPRLQIFLNTSGLGTKAPVSGIRMHSPWDIDAILELKDAEDFIRYRSAYPLERVSVLQSLQHMATGEVRRAISAIYRAAEEAWPSYRAIEVELDKAGDSPEPALSNNFAVTMGDNGPRTRIALTFRGLYLAELSSRDAASLMFIIRLATIAYRASPTRDRVPLSEALAATPANERIGDDEVLRATLLLEGVIPRIVSVAPDGSTDLILGQWLLPLAYAQSLEDVVVAVNPLLLQMIGGDVSLAPLPTAPDAPPIDWTSVAPAQDRGLRTRHDIIVGEKLGFGVHADVYKAHDPQFLRDIAIKVMKSDDQQSVMSHAHALARASHPAIVHLYDVAEVAVEGTRVRALIMEYVGGDDLDDRLEGPTLTREEVQRFSRTLIDAVGALHANKACHGDLHSKNVRIVGRELRILDLYHRPSTLFSSTKSLTANQEQDRRECRAIISQLLEASDFGCAGTAAYRAFEQATRSRTLTLADLSTGLDAALAAS
jgi:hypothetical protein